MPLVKRGNSKFWYVQFQLNHKTFVRSTKTTDRKEAERLETKFRAEAFAEGVIGKKRPITLEAAIDRLLSTKAGTPNYKNLKQHKKSVLTVLARGNPITILSNADLERYRDVRSQMGRAPQTIKHELNLILGSVRYARRLGYDSPDLLPPKVKIASARLRYLSVEEEQRLLDELDPWRKSNGLAAPDLRDARKQTAIQDNFDLVVLLLDTGARYNEIAGLSWSQIDFTAQVIRLWRPKVQNESLIFMTSRVARTLANRKETSRTNCVFSNSKGGPRNYAVTAIRKAMDRAGLADCTVHTLRHTHASRLIQNGMTVYEVKSVLGHADIRTTMRYAHLEQASVTSRARDVIERLTQT